jgi:hypothetical protein
MNRIVTAAAMVKLGLNRSAPEPVSKATNEATPFSAGPRAPIATAQSRPVTSVGWPPRAIAAQPTITSTVRFR